MTQVTDAEWTLTVAVLRRRTASIRLLWYRLGKLSYSPVTDRSDCDDDVAGSFVFLHRNRGARVGEVEVLVVAVEIVVGRQRFVTNFHLSTS